MLCVGYVLTSHKVCRDLYQLAELWGGAGGVGGVGGGWRLVRQPVVRAPQQAVVPAVVVTGRALRLHLPGAHLSARGGMWGVGGRGCGGDLLRRVAVVQRPVLRPERDHQRRHRLRARTATATSSTAAGAQRHYRLYLYTHTHKRVVYD